jgi:hypothetical protein
MKNGVFWDVRPCDSCKNRRRNSQRASVDSYSTDSCHPDEGGAKFLRNVDSYKSHTAWHPRRHNSSTLYMWLLIYLPVPQLLNNFPKYFRKPRPHYRIRKNPSLAPVLSRWSRSTPPHTIPLPSIYILFFPVVPCIPASPPIPYIHSIPPHQF